MKIKSLLLIVIFCFLQKEISAQASSKILKIDKRLRSFIVYKPSNYSEGMPLVLNLHGFTLTGSAQMSYTNFNRFADSVGCMVVYPTGIQKRWGAGTFMGVDNKVDDVSFLGQLIDYMAINYAVDLTRVYSIGYSAGGFMSYRLACDLSGRIAAISPVASSMTQEVFSDCNPTRRIPILCMNGTSDPVVSYYGIPGQFPSTKKVVEFWTKDNLCDPIVIEDTLPNLAVNDNSRVTKTVYLGCGANAPFEFYKILYGGHTWPGAKPFGILGNTNQDINANKIIWDFLSQYDIPQEMVCVKPSNLSSNINDCSAILSWNSVGGTTGYRISIIDNTAKEMKIYQSNTNSFSISTINGHNYSWGVAANCDGNFFNLAEGPSFNSCGNGISNKLAKDNSFNLFPNPTRDILYFQFDKIIGNELVQIVDIVGRNIKEFNLIEGQNQILVADLEVGMYFIKTSFGSFGFVKQ
ncbi:MAG: T9SS type A sorting domain-containing protein [Bacteroidetes bacterium]|nr:T9SS type A sorting domain-containing protein [Bacteroidota bacterium]